MIDNEYPELLFESDDDVWELISKLIEETKEINETMNKDFNIAKSVYAQMPFFACKNIFLDPSSHKDIPRFTYCSEFNSPPYKGSYSEQPRKWVQKSFIIKHSIESRNRDASKGSVQQNEVKDNG